MNFIIFLIFYFMYKINIFTFNFKASILNYTIKFFCLVGIFAGSTTNMLICKLRN